MDFPKISRLYHLEQALKGEKSDLHLTPDGIKKINDELEARHGMNFSAWVSELLEKAKILLDLDSSLVFGVREYFEDLITLSEITSKFILFSGDDDALWRDIAGDEHKDTKSLMGELNNQLQNIERYLDVYLRESAK